jgi:lipoprotein-releasing system ATP-binding protein
MSEAYISIQGLHKSYPSGETEIHVLDGLDLELDKGKMLAVMGESGSGKSTFLHLAGGMEKPDSGRILIGGEDVTAMDSVSLARFRNEKIGFVFQFHHLLPEFSALENVMFPLLLRGRSFRKAEEKGRHLLKEMGLAKREHHKPGELSGGEQQRIAIARALSGDPSLLLGDEPTGNLDTKTSDNIHKLLLEVHQEFGLTSIIVTHNAALAGLCDQTMVMHDGHLNHGGHGDH